MNRVRLAAMQLGFRAGLFRLVQCRVRRHQAVVLTFHRFSGDGQGHPDGLPISRFAEFMAYLTRRCRVVSLHTLTDELRRGVVQPFTAAVTVDDGYHEVFTLAAPVLKAYRVPASFFVVSDFVDGRLWPWIDRLSFVFDRAPHQRLEFRHRGSRHVLELGGDEGRLRARGQWLDYAKRLSVAERDELLDVIAEASGIEIPATAPAEYRAVSWTELRMLAAEGFDVGAHTRTHPILSRVGPEQLRAEVEGCKEQMEERLGFRVRHFAYPNGRREDYTAEAVVAVARAGYAAAVTTIFGGNTPATPPLELRRVAGHPENLAHFARYLSGFDELRMRTRLRPDRMPARSWPAGRAAPATGDE